MSIKFLMRSFCLAGIVFLSLTCVLSQQHPDAGAKPAISPEKRALILDLLEAIEVRKTALGLLNAIFDQDEKQTPEFVWQGLSDTEYFKALSAESKEDLRKKIFTDSARMSTRLRALISERIDFARLVEDISIDLYDKYFTEAEIKDLAIFYRSPTGKKTIETMPKMFSESMSMTIELIKPKMREIISVVTKEEADRIENELEAAKSKPPTKPPAHGRRRKP